MDNPHKRKRIDHEREQALEYVSRKGAKLRQVPEKYRDDKEIVLAGLERDSWGLKYVSSRLADDPEVVLKAVSRNSQIRVSKKLFADKALPVPDIPSRLYGLGHLPLMV